MPSPILGASDEDNEHTTFFNSILIIVLTKKASLVFSALTLYFLEFGKKGFPFNIIEKKHNIIWYIMDNKTIQFAIVPKRVDVDYHYT